MVYYCTTKKPFGWGKYTNKIEYHKTCNPYKQNLYCRDIFVAYKKTQVGQKPQLRICLNRLNNDKLKVFEFDINFMNSIF